MVPLEPTLHLTNLPRPGGRIGPQPYHFRVEELGKYPLSGEGEHLWVSVQKTGLTTQEAVRAIARAAGVRPPDVGFAGMKDKHAVTTQWFSLPARGVPSPDSWDLPETLTIIATTRHANKLRTGHLSGNRFEILLVDVAPDAEVRARAILEGLAEAGLPNYFGAQRFGRGGQNLAAALLWARGEGPRSRDRFANKLLPSVLQAEVFNRYASERAALGTSQLIAGEVVRLNGSGSTFVIEDTVAEQPRLEAKDIHLTGPIFGPKAKEARGEAAELEARALGSLDLDAAMRSHVGRHAAGTRRDLLVYPTEVRVRTMPEGLEVSFVLPAGSYATQVVRELTGGSYSGHGDRVVGSEPEGAASSD
jgi:tRNA pseudouridine13 synthase